MRQLGDFSLDFDRVGTYEGRSLSGDNPGGVAHFYRLVAGRELDVEIAWVTWLNNERGVRMSELRAGPARLGRLMKGGRVGIYDGEDVGLPHDIEWCQLRVMQERAGALPTAVDKSYSDMVRAAGGEEIWTRLSEFGALAIGPRSHLLREGVRRRTLITTFPAGEADVPIAAYVLTKVLPILNRFKG